MAEKHKSKYKAPKDLEKSQKPKARKDLKDYTTDDKKGKMNPKSDGSTIPNLLRKTDKPVVDDGTYDVKWSNDDRLYDDLENGDYDPKKALKRLKKREDAEENEGARKVANVDNLPFFAVFQNGELVQGKAASKEEAVVNMLEGLK